MDDITMTRNELAEMFGPETIEDVYDADDARQVHVYHHRDDDRPRINVSVEKNSKGYNWTVTVTSAADLDQAIRIIGDAEERLRNYYGGNGRE